ncbi:hypothetical protein SNE40_004044 [Patella caerulea]|uniref:Battenin n=1 Tax=Patella caerulea TaxID=87958 RepID=A0AAN8KFJ9_PATCE
MTYRYYFKQVVVGCSAAFGENVTLGFLSKFPSHLVNAWSSGTGMAGLLGSTIYIIFGCSVGNGEDKTRGLHTLTKYAFLLTTPVVLVYWLAYFIVIKTDKEQPIEIIVNKEEDSERTPILENDCESNEGYDVETPCQRIWRCLKLILWMGFNLCAVYVFEYVARGCAAKVRHKSEYHVGCPELYAALQLCYQAGVFVSRSSVQLFTIKRVDILTLLQLINMILWIFDVHWKFLPVSVLPALMIFVGLLGGASYVNIFYQLLHSGKYPTADRELCINITALFITLGICLGTALETSLFTTVLKHD